MKQASENRATALSALRVNWTPAIIVSLVICAICAAFNVPIQIVSNFATGVGAVAVLPLQLAYVIVLMPIVFALEIMFLNFLRGEERALEVGNLFNKFSSYIGVSLLRYLYTVLWSFLLIIPGIIKSYSYAMTPYIVKDNPGISADAAIEASRAMMKGHKFDLFYLHLTFLGWGILCLFTCGIGFLWLSPYILTAQADFYQSLLEESAVSSTTTSSTEAKF